MLDRQKVAEDVKGLDQPTRATLRKYGVRFGAYHIYIPPLLKPAPRTLATQLFALKHEGAELSGLDEVQHLAAGGRTSIPVSETIDSALYRPAGYRVCGARAVRVDILERLADLIRPALAWREGAPGTKPAGAVDGRGFTVTVAMTSLAGSSGEDFASILRSLGYRMERRPKPVEPAAAIEPALDAQGGTEQTSGDAVIAAAMIESDASEATIAPGESAADNAEPTATANARPENIAESGAAAEPVVEPDHMKINSTGEATPPETPALDLASEQGVSSGASPAEEAFIEVWRPGRPPGEKRVHHRRPRRPHRDTEHAQSPAAAEPAADGAAAMSLASGDDAPAAMPDQEQPGRRRHGRPHRGKRHDRHQKPGRPDGKTQERQQRPERQGRQGSAKRGEERRERAPDPNSPFAKLAALKAQLEADAKERR